VRAADIGASLRLRATSAMERRKRKLRWRVISYSAAPFLVLFAVLLFRTGNGAGRIVGIVLVVLGVLAILVPQLSASRR